MGKVSIVILFFFFSFIFISWRLISLQYWALWFLLESNLYSLSYVAFWFPLDAPRQKQLRWPTPGWGPRMWLADDAEDLPLNSFTDASVDSSDLYRGENEKSC